MSKFLPTKFNIQYSIGPVISCNNLEYPKKLRKLHNDHPLAQDKIEIRREMLSKYQLNIADFYNIPIGNVRKLVDNSFC